MSPSVSFLQHGFNVLALGQHLDDLAESFIMSAFNNGQINTMKVGVSSLSPSYLYYVDYCISYVYILRECIAYASVSLVLGRLWCLSLATMYRCVHLYLYINKYFFYYIYISMYSITYILYIVRLSTSK